MKRSIIGRVDLLQLHTPQTEARAGALARLLGYELRLEQSLGEAALEMPALEVSAEAAAVKVDRRPLRDAVFWHGVEYEELQADEAGRQRIERADEPPEPIVIKEPVYKYLSSWEKLEPRLRMALARKSDSHRLDIPKIVDQLCRARIPAVLPYEQRSGWGASLQVVDDRGKHLAPYLADHMMVQQRLALLFSGDALETAIRDPVFDEPLIHT
ncbi:MAG: hypothetical protein GY717_17560, partial [Rhodobacteraceae bacterium]|nr:hypothetical protein [Paracoccaceae bacterium]